MENNRSMRGLLIIGIGVSVLFLLVCEAFSATYYVATTGNDSNNGSAGAPWRTIQKCADNAAAGDTCNVAAGSYGSPGNPITVTSHASGSSGNLITFQGAGASSTTLWGAWNITHNYNRVTGFKIDSRDIGSYVYTIYITGSYNQLLNNTITSTKAANSLTYTGGIQLTAASSYTTVSNNVISNHTYLSLIVMGNNHTFSRNEWIGRPSHVREDPSRPGVNCNFPAYDRAYIFATYYTEDGEIIHGWDGGNCLGGPHVDIWQSFTGADTESGNNVIKNNVIYDIRGDAQLCNFDGPNKPGVLHDWTWYNNVIYNVAHGTCNVYAGERFKWYNNLFYNIGYVSGGHVLIYALPATQGEIFNNVFIGCGRRDVASWAGSYGFDSGTGSGDYNYVAQSQASGYAAKTGFKETHGINGGDPKFVNVSGSDFHLQSDSRAVGAGTRISGFSTDKDGKLRPQTSGWSIGAYEPAGPGDRPPTPRGLHIN